MVRGDGAVVWVETNFTLIDGERPGEPARIVSVARNIQARKEMEAELIEAREAAEAAAAAKSDFLANMTHELRTPLNAIIGFADVLRGSPRLKGDDARHSRLICDASATLLDLVNSVLDFSRLEAGAVELDPAPFDPAAEAARDRRAAVRPGGRQGPDPDAARRGPGALDRRRAAPAPGAAELHLQRRQVHRQGRRHPVADRRADAGEGARRLRVEVTDTGVGIPESQIAHVFERFTQADVSVSRRFGGTGPGPRHLQADRRADGRPDRRRPASRARARPSGSRWRCRPPRR